MKTDFAGSCHDTMDSCELQLLVLVDRLDYKKMSLLDLAINEDVDFFRL